MSSTLVPAWRRYLTVEPVIFFYAYGLMTAMPFWQQYIYRTLSNNKGFPYDDLVMKKEGRGCKDNMILFNATLTQLEQEVQSVAAKIDMANTFFMAIPSLIVAPFWGPWTDKSRRRKPALCAPVIGVLLETILMLLIMHFRWPLYVMFVGSAITGCSGFLTTMMLACMSYIADTTEKTGVAFRIAVIQMLVFMGGVISRLTSGLWIEMYGFIAPTWLVLACHVASGASVIFLVPEQHERVPGQENRFFDLASLKTVLNVFRKPRECGRKNLLLLVFASGIITLTTMGLGGVTALFVMRSPLCFSPTLIGYFLAYRLFMSGIGGAIGVKLLRKFFSEVTTSRIGIISQMCEMLMIAFSTRPWMVFLAPMVGFFKGCVDPVFLGIMSRIVGIEEQGSLFCAYGIINIISNFVGAMMFNNVYESTLHLTFNGFVFILCAIIKIIPFCLLSCMKVPPLTTVGDDVDDKKNNQNVDHGELNANAEKNSLLKEEESGQGKHVEKSDNKHDDKPAAPLAAMEDIALEEIDLHY